MKKLKKTAQLVGEFNQLFNRCSIKPQDRQAVMCLGIARYVGYELDLPTSEVHNPRSHFIEMHKGAMDEFLSSINEQFVIDVETTADLAFKIWTMRYNLLFNPSSLSLEGLMGLCQAKKFSEAEYSEKWSGFCKQLCDTLVQFTQPE